MRHSRSLIRLLAVALVAAAVLGASGCKWFRKGSELYAGPPETRPLEVPPDLDRPDTSGAMQIPGTGSVTRSSIAAPASPQPNGFAVAGDQDAVFTRVGEVLAATPGLTIVNRAQLLGTYDVDYEDAKFLIRVTRTDSGAYVAAVDPRGLPAAGEPPQKLIAALRAALAP
ncbi:Beta-barrel assembly machine subunit BamC [Luteimonas sp. J16]|jgi:uncharacterized lipoprotein|uniref:hypothetical protein n=1 Tax=unclassified Luteimonas TaxID=2629088 RepID=UPI000478D4E0|nr:MULTISPECIES: hypothetical protein [unclassified Luteimonas]TWG88732.1 Beta-barrel assembly machine subunit BamC [Luteimonas sp. J16]